MHRLFRQIHTHLRGATRVLIIPHQNPDGDALGAATALAEFLHLHNIPRRIFCATPASAHFDYLPHIEILTNDPAVWQEEFSHIVVVDSGDPIYAGIADHLAALTIRPTIINIDHHPTNQHYGDVNLVVPTASSTNEILYQLFTHNRVPITAHMATSLMTGLLTDTGTFTNGGTTKLALWIGSELIKKGADWAQIKNYVIRDKNLPTLKLWGEVLTRLTHDEASDVVYTWITQEDYQKFGVAPGASEGMSNLLNYLSDGSAALVVEERADGQVKGSFRTTHEGVNVAAWAKALGGGGHIKAAGFRTPGPLTEAIHRILAIATASRQS